MYMDPKSSLNRVGVHSYILGVVRNCECEILISLLGTVGCKKLTEAEVLVIPIALGEIEKLAPPMRTGGCGGD